MKTGLGRIIRQEQQAGSLASQDRSKMSNIGVTHLKDYGLTRMDSSRAQVEIAEKLGWSQRVISDDLTEFSKNGKNPENAKPDPLRFADKFEFNRVSDTRNSINTITKW